MDANFPNQTNIEAIFIACLRDFARRGRQLRKARVEAEELPCRQDPEAEECQGEKLIDLAVIESIPHTDVRT